MFPASSPGMAVQRRVRGAGTCRRLRVIPDLVVMGEGGEGELAGWTFMLRWASPHHSVTVQSSIIVKLKDWLLSCFLFHHCLSIFVTFTVTYWNCNIRFTHRSIFSHLLLLFCWYSFKLLEIPTTCKSFHHASSEFYAPSLHIHLKNHMTQRVSWHLTLRTPHVDDEAIQLTAQEVALVLQLLDAFLQPGVLLQSDVQVSPQVRDQDEGAVLRVRRLLHHRLCRKRNVFINTKESGKKLKMSFH